MKTSETFDLIFPALHKARGAFKAAVKDGTNPHFKSKYVTLDAVIDAVQTALHTNGILLLQPTRVEDAQTILETVLAHTSGQWIASDYPVHPIKADPQGEGSALTYARRYALMSLVGIAPEDDDGNAATAAAAKPVELGGTPQSGNRAQDFPPDRQIEIMAWAQDIKKAWDAGDPPLALKHWKDCDLPNEERAAVWFELGSKTRTWIKDQGKKV